MLRLDVSPLRRLHHRPPGMVPPGRNLYTGGLSAPFG
jgi:hypothetical protein